ncbi:MAG: hypothetical protein U9R05_00745, partial [Chloroflexota bacterium]|nr:hypothetical protein [Chloroflexota bacterium]
MVAWILFDDSSIEDGFNDMPTFKIFLQSVLHCMTFDEIVSSLYSFADEFDIHSKWPFVYKIDSK